VNRSTSIVQVLHSIREGSNPKPQQNLQTGEEGDQRGKQEQGRGTNKMRQKQQQWHQQNPGRRRTMGEEECMGRHGGRGRAGTETENIYRIGRRSRQYETGSE
jgi:hypothetical protein